LSEPPAALGVFSGVGVSQETWKLAGPNRKGLKVFQVHGTQVIKKIQVEKKISS
jgi:hypothetical protein